MKTLWITGFAGFELRVDEDLLKHFARRIARPLAVGQVR